MKMKLNNESYKDNIARNIKYLRNTRLLTQGQLGGMLGVRENTVCQWETGNRTPSLGILIDISNKFQSVTLDELIKTKIRY